LKTHTKGKIKLKDLNQCTMVILNNSYTTGKKI
jgi:hypothetical protein